MNLERIKQLPLLRAIFYPYILIKRNRIKKADETFDSDFERMFELVTNDPLRVNVPNFNGDFDISKDSLLLRSILKEKAYEPELLNLIKTLIDPTKDFIDIGANIGLFSVFFSRVKDDGRKVLAVEPNTTAIEKLKGNLARHDCKDVILFEGAVGSEKGEITLHSVFGKEEYSSLKPLVHVHAKQFEQETHQVKVEKLDVIVSENDLTPGFIKMDVEGAEFEVLKGAKDMLERFMPVIVSEMDNALLKSFGTDVKEVTVFLEDLGYVVSDARTGGPARGGFSDTLLAVPRNAQMDVRY